MPCPRLNSDAQEERRIIETLIAWRDRLRREARELDRQAKEREEASAPKEKVHNGEG